MVIKNLSEYSNGLELLLELSSSYSIDRPYIVGGLVRNYLLGISELNSDVDLTTNSPECIRLGILFSFQSGQFFKMFEDRHIRVFYFGKNFDFSPSVLSFSHPGVKQWLSENKSESLKNIEAFSRDFTINSMYQDFETGEIFDPTEMGKIDIESKIIRTPIPAEITIKNDPRRIFRAIKLASKFGFSIDSDIIDYVRNNSEIILNPKLTTQYITLEINEAFETNSEIAISNIFDLGLFKLIPLSGKYSEYLIKNKLLSKYLS